MKKCNITSKELAKALDITEDKLYEICDFFDSNPDDDWELIENEHFEWGAYKSRLFSYEGAVEICNYLQENKDQRPFFGNFKRWLFQRDERLNGLMVTKRIEEASAAKGQLIFIGGRAFLAPKSCRQVIGLGTRQDVLDRTFSEIMKNENTEIETLRLNHDFYLDDKTRYFSGSGLASIGQQLSLRLTKKHRKAWASVVSKYAPKALAFIEKQESERDKRIDKAMKRVRDGAQGRCQVTNRRQSVDKFDLEVHHLYDKKSYPNIAHIEANMIAIGSDKHTDFHQWMGGTNKGCTLEDFEQFIEEFSESLFGDTSEPKNYEWMMKVRKRLSEAKKLLYGHLHF